jgi:hypothetical protein
VTPDAPLRRAVPHLTVASVAFVAFALGFAAIQLLWLEELRSPRVVLLGSGDHLSVLVTAGDARLLIASGDDPAAFGNALGRVLPPSQERLDLVLVAGTGDNLRAATVAASHPGTRSVAALAPFPRSPDLPALLGVPLIGAPRRIDLGGVAVTVEAAPTEDAEEDEWSWRATVERGTSRIVVLSDGPAADRFPGAASATLLVVAGGDPMAGWRSLPSPALALPDAAIPPVNLRETAANGERVPSHVVRVFPGEAVPLEFVDGGIALPGESTVGLKSADDDQAPTTGRTLPADGAEGKPSSAPPST